jgi:hypothetical protein
MTKINGTILGPYPGNGQGYETRNMTAPEGNFTRPLPLPMNWTGAGNATEGNFTRPPPIPMHGNWSGNVTEGNLTSPPPGADHGPMQENATAPDTMNTVLAQGMQQESNNDFTEAFLALLRSYFNSRE